MQGLPWKEEITDFTGELGVVWDMNRRDLMCGRMEQRERVQRERGLELEKIWGWGANLEQWKLPGIYEGDPNGGYGVSPVMSYSQARLPVE